MMGGETWDNFGSKLASLMFMYAMFQQYIPYTFRSKLESYYQQLMRYLNPNIQITFQEFVGKHLNRSHAYTAIRTYLTSISSKEARRLKAYVEKDSSNLLLTMDDYEEIRDEYQGVKLIWVASKTLPKTKSFSFYPTNDEKRYYTLSFHKRHRELVVDSYLNHVLGQGNALAVQNRQRRLYTNSFGNSGYGFKKTTWSYVAFDHPATFQTLAMEAEKKNEIMDDLIMFSKSEDYYRKVGKAWKRGYLLYGPPGTGKSTMIAAMANLLNYDVYDLELTAVKENTELRKLLIETSGRSIIVIEDIDCSLDLTGQRKRKSENEDEEEEDPVCKRVKEENSSKDSKVTLSGLLNFIDGLWSACGGERIIVFTTNHVEQLDPALIRRGRMDKHIELSYCSFEGFKVLAKNYLDVDSHNLFETIRHSLGETQMTPADVAENLMLTTFTKNPEACLENLIQALNTVKEESKKRAKDEPKEKEQARLEVEKKVKEETRLKSEEQAQLSKDEATQDSPLSKGNLDSTTSQDKEANGSD